MILTVQMDNVIATHDEPIRKYLNTTIFTLDNLEQAYSEGQLKTLPAEPSASEVLWKLSDEGNHIKVVVNRFIGDGLNHKIVTHTTDWLDRKDIPYREILFITQPVMFVTDVFIGTTLSKSIPNTALTIPYQFMEPLPGKNKWETVYEKIENLP